MPPLPPLLAVLALQASAARTTRGPILGRLRPRLSSEIASSKWSVGAETMDRNLTVWSDYESYLPPLGAKRARLQCGWGRCDRTGIGAPYNWAWLDEPVFGLAPMGVKPWLELSYGNSHYEGGGTNGPGASVPNSTVALTAWAGWVTAVAERYANVTDEFELWNEPSLSASNYLPYATLANWTCRALHAARVKQGDRSHLWKPRLFYGTMSGQYASSGPAFLDGTLPLLKEQLAGSGLGLQDCVAAVTYHAYTLHPEDTHKRTHTGPACGTAADGGAAPCSGVEALARTLDKHVPGAFVFQGECGAPSTWERGGAMAHPLGFNWTETRQAKWNLRSMIGDAATPLVRYSSVFSAMDVCYDAGPWENIGNYGLLAASCLPIEGSTCSNLQRATGTRVCLNKTVDHIKPAFAAAQSVMQLFDDDLEPVMGVAFKFECDRKPTNATPPLCPASAHATPPAAGMHCDLKNTTHLGMQPAEDAGRCQEMCCADSRCNCWAFSSGGYNAGCWLQNSPAPLQPVADKNVSGGIVAPHGSAPPAGVKEGFDPVGYAFRNRTAAAAGGEITHIVVWDASPGCSGEVCNTIREDDRLTRCTVTVASETKPVPTKAGSSSGDSGGGGRAVTVMLTNGTVHSMSEGEASFESDRVKLDVVLYDAPLLVARSDAIPPIDALV